MKKNFLIFLLAPLFVLLLSCNKDEKFPTKKDLKGHWEYCEINEKGKWFYRELFFDNKSLHIINSYTGKVEKCNYRLDIAIKKIYFTSGVLERKFYEIWIDKKTGLLYIEDTYRFTADDVSPATYKKFK